MKKAKKIYKDLIIASFLTVFILVLSHIDNSCREVSTFDLNEYFSKFKSNIENVEEVENDLLISEDEENIDILEEDQSVENSDSKLFVLKGTSSHYADKFHGKMTANGEIFNMNDYSAAHKKLPFGTILKIVNQKNGKTVLVRVNDRGPYVHNRILDLSYSAAKDIGNLGLPKIKAIGFDNQTLKNTDPNSQFLAFSEDKEFKIFDKELVKVKYKSDDFTKALKAYRELKNKSNINNIYIFQPASENYYNSKEYLIGTVNTSVLFANN